MAGVTLRSPSAGCASVTNDVVADLIWVHTVPADGLEHVRARVGAGRVDIIFFLRFDTQEGAESSAREICRRVVSSTSIFAGWNYTKEGEE
jgi:hypothetical protein